MGVRQRRVKRTSFIWEGIACLHVESSRKTAIIEIQYPSVLIRTPRGVPLASVFRILQSRGAWVHERLQDMHVAYKMQSPELADGRTILYEGKEYPVEIWKGAPCQPTFQNGVLICGDDCGRAIERWYKKNARSMILELINKYTSMIGVCSKRVRVTNTRSRWGSCSSRGTISICWRLIMAPPEVLQYVVVHELVHLKHMNHSTLFWEEVALHMPTYGTHRKWLKDNGHILRFHTAWV